jgi:hypothetical protein
VSLPDISSTEIAPNKLNAPASKIININHIRGLQYYQKQLGKRPQPYFGIDPGAIDDLAKSKPTGAVSILRNRSTSPTIIPKKNLVRSTAM